MNAMVQHFHFEPGTLIKYDGFQIVVEASVKGGVAVYDRFVAEGNSHKKFVLEDSFIKQLLTRNDVEIDAHFMDNSVHDARATAKANRFADLSAVEQLEALQKEAWCLAAKAILKVGTFTETRIKQNYDALQAEAHKLQKRLALGNTAGNGSFTARDWKARSVRDFCRVYFSLTKPDPFVLRNRHVDKGCRTTRLKAEESRLLDVCCAAFLSTSQPFGSSIIEFVKRRFGTVSTERQAAGNFEQFTTPHKNTVYARLKKFTKFQLVVGREGFQAAQKDFSPTQHGTRALKPGELLEIDFWKGDVFTLSEKCKFWDLLSPDLQIKLKADADKTGKRKQVQRIWICAAIDVATRNVLGLALAETPNSRTVIDVLDMIMRDKSDISQRAGCIRAWTQHCGLGTIVMDTGEEFFNAAVQTAIINAGGSFLYGRTSNPMDKPFVERLFGGFSTMFADELPGKTGNASRCLEAYDKMGRAAFNVEELHQLIIRHIVDRYHLEHHGGLGCRPVDAWKTAQKYGCVRPPQPRERRNATGISLNRCLNKTGVRVFGIPFGDPVLFPKHVKNGPQTVVVKLDPNDLREITVFIDGAPVYLKNQLPSTAHHSIRTLMAAIRDLRTSKPDDLSVYEYTLAKQADWFAEKIASGIKARGLTSTTTTVAEIDQFESNFCFRLQFIQNPETAVSADIDAMLAGKPGQGIWSPEDIALEKTMSSTDLASPPPEDEDSPETTAAGPVGRTFAHPPSKTSTQKAQVKTLFTGQPKGKGILK